MAFGRRARESSAFSIDIHKFNSDVILNKIQELFLNAINEKKSLIYSFQQLKYVFLSKFYFDNQ